MPKPSAADNNKDVVTKYARQQYGRTDKNTLPENSYVPR